MGGGVGAELVKALRTAFAKDIILVVLGANASATERMLKAGADRGASGENAVRISAAHADIIAGPIGIVLPNAMMGEITPGIAEAVMNARGKKVLIPLNQSHFEIAGMPKRTLEDLIAEAVAAIRGM